MSPVARNVGDDDQEMTALVLEYGKYHHAMAFLATKINESLPRNMQILSSQLPGLTVSEFLTDLTVHPARLPAFSAQITKGQGVTGPLAYNFAHPAQIMEMLRTQLLATCPAEIDVEIKKLQSMKCVGDDFTGFIALVDDQISVLTDLNIPTPPELSRSIICNGVPQHAQIVITSNPMFTTVQIIAALNAHFKVHALQHPTRVGKVSPGDSAVALWVGAGGRGRGARRGEYGRDQARNHGDASNEDQPTNEHEHDRQMGLCYACHKPGHIAKHCRYTRTENQTSAYDQKQGVKSRGQPAKEGASTAFCVRCGSKNHLEDGCRFKRRVEKLQKKISNMAITTNESDESDESDDALGFMARTITLQNYTKGNFLKYQIPLDTAADRHMTPYLEFLIPGTIKVLAKRVIIGGVNPNAPLYATHVASMYLPQCVQGKLVWRSIRKVLLVPGLPCTIVSLGYLQQKGYDVTTHGVKGDRPGNTQVSNNGVVCLEGTQLPGTARTYLSLWEGETFVREKFGVDLVPLRAFPFTCAATHPTNISNLVPNVSLLSEKKESLPEEKGED